MRNSMGQPVYTTSYLEKPYKGINFQLVQCDQASAPLPLVLQLLLALFSARVPLSVF
jgi:hypothetical protein